MSRRLRTRLDKLAGQVDHSGRCPECPPQEIIAIRKGQPEPKPTCPRCGRLCNIVLVVEEIVAARE